MTQIHPITNIRFQSADTVTMSRGRNIKRLALQTGGLLLTAATLGSAGILVHDLVVTKQADAEANLAAKAHAIEEAQKNLDEATKAYEKQNILDKEYKAEWKIKLKALKAAETNYKAASEELGKTNDRSQILEVKKNMLKAQQELQAKQAEYDSLPQHYWNDDYNKPRVEIRDRYFDAIRKMISLGQSEKLPPIIND